MTVGKTFNVLISCCLDPTRTEQLRETVDSLRDVLLDDTIVIDNGSTDSNTRDILGRFSRVIWLEQNYGYWSAVNYAVKNCLTDEYRYLYVIESDAVHYDYARIAVAEKFLDVADSIGSVRLQEFEYDKRHLYDKISPHSESRRWAWTRFSNFFKNELAYFRPANGGQCYITNLAPQVPALNRVPAMVEIFSGLQKLDAVSETDFQREYFRLFDETAILDHGIYNCKSSYERAVTGSYTDPTVLASLGYRTTRQDRMVPVEDMHIKL